MSNFTKINETQVTINGKVIDFPASIWYMVETPDLCIVILHPGYSMVNVFAHDKFGNHVWTIEKADFEMDGDGYCDVTDFQTELIAYSRGIHFHIDPKTGKITGSYNERGGGYRSRNGGEANIVPDNMIEKENVDANILSKLWRKIAKYLN